MSKSGPGNAAFLSSNNALSLTTPGHFQLWRRGARHALVIASCWAGTVLFGQATDYKFYTVGGIGGTGGTVDGHGGSPAAASLFNYPASVAVDGTGNVYVADSANDEIRKVTPDGAVSTLAGAVGVPGSLDGTGKAANFNGPLSVAIDSSGNLFVADYRNGTIRKVTSAGVVTLFAGAAGVTGSVNGTGSGASFSAPRSVAVDSSGNVYVADTGNNLIRKITSAGVVTTLAGTAGTAGSTNGTGTAASFNFPSGVAVDTSGNVYVADTFNQVIRKITSAGVVTTLAGTVGTLGHVDSTDGSPTFDYPSGVAVDSSGNLYVADQGNSVIRKITASGVVSTLAGTALALGRTDGTGAAARFTHPSGVAVGSTGTVYVADYENHMIRKISATGDVVTLAGTGGVRGSLDGTGYILSPSEFWRPTNLAMDGSGNIYVSDTFNDTIRKISPTGVTSTVAGVAGTAGSADTAAANGSTAAVVATFNGPSGVAVDGSGIIYVADTYNHTIRKVAVDGTVTTLAGTPPAANTVGTPGFANGTGAAAKFSFPSGLAVSPDNSTLYVADYGNDVIRAIDIASQAVTTFAGTAGVAGSGNGNGTGASFDQPRDVAIDSSGNLYVADTGNHVIRKITPAGDVSTLAGSAGSAGAVDGNGTGAKFDGPAGVGVDSSGNVFVADSNSSTIRKITPAGAVTTVGGSAGVSGDVDATGTAARFNFPTGIVVDSAGNLFIADNNNNTIREGVAPTTTTGPIVGPPISSGNPNGGGTPGGTAITLTGVNGTGSFLNPAGLTMDSAGTVYIADTQHHTIKKVTSAAIVTVLAGKDNTSGSADGVGTAATFSGPTGVALGTGNVLYVTDTGNATIRQILPDGTVTTLAGSTTAPRGNVDGTGTAASFRTPSGIVVDSAGNLYVADSTSQTIRKVTTGTGGGVVTTVAGQAQVVGDADGVGTAALFDNPTGLAIDSANNVYIADTYNDTIRVMVTTAVTTTSPAYTVSTLAGSAGVSGSYDGIGNYALFNLPRGLTVNTNTAVYLTDTGNNTIRYIALSGTAAGSVGTIAGYPGIKGALDGIGSAAQFNQPQSIYYNSTAGGLYLADTGNSVIRFIYLSSNVVTTPTFTTSTTNTGGGSTGSSSSGGGALEAWFALTLIALGGARLWSDRHERRVRR